MRPWVAAFLTFSLLVASITASLGPLASASAGGGQPLATISIRPTTKSVAPGSTFTLDIALDMQSGSHEVSVATLLLGFDSSVLQATSFIPLGTLQTLDSTL